MKSRVVTAALPAPKGKIFSYYFRKGANDARD
jgi:hypothetical protein